MKPLLLLTTILTLMWLYTSETFTGIPSAITQTALTQKGFYSLLLSGTAAERHAYAHGQPTKYGSMPFDTDRYLQAQGWSEKHIHEVGHLYGFSELRGR